MFSSQAKHSIANNMGNCKFCGEPAGLLKSSHSECATFVDETGRYISEVILHLFKTGHDPQSFLCEINGAVERSKMGRQAYENAVLVGFGMAVDAALEDGVLTDDEEARLTTTIDGLGMEEIINQHQQCKVRLVQAKVLRDVLSGEPRQRVQFEGHFPFILATDEIPLWAFAGVDCYEIKARRHYEGRSGGVSIRIMKGVYYRAGAFRGQPVDVQVTEKTGSGDLVVTTKNIFFAGAKHTKIPIKKLISIHPFSDGIQLQKEGVRSNPVTYTPLDGWFAVNLISNLQNL